jgi:hypothetical protein
VTKDELNAAALRIAKLIFLDAEAFFMAVENEPLEVLDRTRRLLDRVAVRYAKRNDLEMVESLYPFVELIKAEAELRQTRLRN